MGQNCPPKKWTQIGIFKPAEPHSPLEACLLLFNVFPFLLVCICFCFVCEFCGINSNLLYNSAEILSVCPYVCPSSGHVAQCSGPARHMLPRQSAGLFQATSQLHNIVHVYYMISHKCLLIGQ